MVKEKSIGDINGWVFISIGFIVIAVSIFFYDTLKVFIAIGGIMTLYGMGKLSYDNLKAKIFPKDDDEGPVDLDKTANPYIQHEKTKQAIHQQQMQRHHTIQQQANYRQPTIHHTEQRSDQIPQQTHPGKYCYNCGAAVQLHHRFCSNCGAHVSR